MVTQKQILTNFVKQFVKKKSDNLQSFLITLQRYFYDISVIIIIIIKITIIFMPCDSNFKVSWIDLHMLWFGIISS